jgi:ATP-dependent RNA helicase DeaD
MDDIFDTSKSFADLGLGSELLQAIEQLGFEHPTIVQSKLIPLAIEGRHILGQSKTGTGKTAAFGLPLFQTVSTDTAVGALILVPTRELAIQVTNDLRHLGQFSKLRTLAIYGGQRMKVQIDKLQKNPNIIVGTPGRVMDMHRRGLLPYDNIKVAVLDEVDRMLDIGFRDDIRAILGRMRHRPQTIFVSATISKEIERLARQYMDDPVRLVLAKSQSLTVNQVQQHYFNVEPWDKKRLLVYLLKHEEPALTLIFCRTKQTVDALTAYVNRKGIEAHAIHGDMYQGQRNRVMQKLRGGQLTVLIASDLAARGLDVDDISHVINYDLPEDPEIYVHRIGRTARAGRDGIAWAFVAPGQGDLLTAIEKLTNSEIPVVEYDDFKPGPVPAEVSAQREQSRERQAAMRSEYSRVAVVPPREQNDATKFPGGIVPAEPPARRMGGRLRIRRR